MVYLHGCPETDARGTDAVYALRSVHLSDAGMSPADEVVHLAEDLQPERRIDDPLEEVRHLWQETTVVIL